MTSPLLCIVDDEPEMSNFITEVGQQAGYAVHAVDGARPFRHFLSSAHPDVVVLDLVMPDVDGIELLLELAMAENKAGFILITGYDPSYLESAALIARHRGLRVIGTLTKPFRFEELSEMLSRGTPTH